MTAVCVVELLPEGRKCVHPGQEHACFLGWSMLHAHCKKAFCLRTGPAGFP